jgi:ornithine decarboxylase antizyme 1
VFDSLPGLCIIPDLPHTTEHNNSDDLNNNTIICKSDGSVGNLNQLLPRIRHNSTTTTTTGPSSSSSSRSSSLTSIESIGNDTSLPIDFENIADHPNAVQLVFKSTISDEKEIEWKASLINETNLYVDIPTNHLTEGTRDSFVSLLEFAEDKLNCERVFVVLNKTRADRSSLMNAFRFFGFKAVAPGNKFAPQNPDLITMVYEIE